MPYIPTSDRPVIDAAVELVAQEIASTSPKNFDLLARYKAEFLSIGGSVVELNKGGSVSNAHPLAQALHSVASKYGYDGAILGELNYAVTRLIQRVPQMKVASKQWEASSELRYWLYAVTVEALTFVHGKFVHNGFGVAGVFEDIKDEYKIRVNQAYEAAQILKSGDCYDTPFYSKLLPVKYKTGELIGHVHVGVVRSESNIKAATLDGSLTVSKHPEGLIIHDDGHDTVNQPPATPEAYPVEIADVKRGRGRPPKKEVA